MIYRFLALCVLAAAPAAAYVLHARPAVASQPPCALTARGACAGAPTRAAASMNLGDRFVRLVKSNVNQALGAMEDPEKVLEQAVADMQRDLTKVRQAYAEVSASSKRAEEQSKLAQGEADKWYQRAQLALEKGEEELAREALCQTVPRRFRDTSETLQRRLVRPAGARPDHPKTLQRHFRDAS